MSETPYEHFKKKIFKSRIREEEEEEEEERGLSNDGKRWPPGGTQKAPYGRRSR